MTCGNIFPKGLGGIIFDCDGVMIDSREANSHFYNSVLSCFGLPPLTPEQAVFAHMGTGMQVLESILPPDCFARLGEVLWSKVNYQRDILPRITLMPGFLPFAEQAHTLGLRLAIATNRTTNGVQDVLDFFALPPYFDPVMTATNASPKPSPEATLAVRKAWGMEPERILMVGDSPSDRDAAKGAGIVFAAFGENQLEGDIKAENFAALARALPAFSV